MSKAKGNGRDKDGFQVVDGNAPKERRKKGSALVGAPPRERTQHLPGMEPVTVPKIHQAIEEYTAIRDARMDMTRKEVDAKAKLLRVMKEEGLATYAVDGHEAEIEAGEETVKARLIADDLEAAEEAELSGGPRRPRPKAAPQPEAQA